MSNIDDNAEFKGCSKQLQTVLSTAQVALITADWGRAEPALREAQLLIEHWLKLREREART